MTLTLEELKAKAREDEGAQEAPQVDTPQEEVPPVEPPPVLENTQEEAPEEEWTPDYNFKVLDKEHSFPEYVRPIITKENYDEMKDVYSRAYGLPHVKERAQRYEEELKNVKPLAEKYTQQNQSLEYLGGLLNKGDFATFAEELKIPKEAVIKYALDLVQYDDLPADQKKDYDMRRNDSRRLSELERKNQFLQQQYTQNTVQARMNQLDQSLSVDSVKSLAEQFDNRQGRQGAFRDEVINRAALVEMQTQYQPGGPTILTPQQAVDEVVKLYGPAFEQQVNAKADQSRPGQQAIQPKEKPVIPVVKAGHKSPARKTITSLDELRAIQQAKLQEG